MLVWLRSARSTSSSSTGSANAFHQSPRGCASAGAASVQRPSPSLKASGVDGSLAGSIGGSDAEHPASVTTNKAVKILIAVLQFSSLLERGPAGDDCRPPPAATDDPCCFSARLPVRARRST